MRNIQQHVWITEARFFEDTVFHIFIGMFFFFSSVYYKLTGVSTCNILFSNMIFIDHKSHKYRDRSSIFILKQMATNIFRYTCRKPPNCIVLSIEKKE